VSALASLREEGADRLDPVRFAYLEALARRLAGQPAAVRRLLEEKLERGVAEYAARLAQAREVQAIRVVGGVRRTAAAGAGTPLAQLNQALRGAAGAGELASVGRFREAWTSNRIQQQVEQAVARRPANAGPLNSHVLVLQSLSVLRAVSPEYLRHFLAHVEALQWLEHSVADKPAAKAVKRVRKRT
jgi:hypothetical protein